jgi:hypothetical protein
MAQFIPFEDRQTHCGCADPGCPVHKGASECKGHTDTRLYRVDMRDTTGTLFCWACADDAFDSGLFLT